MRQLGLPTRRTAVACRRCHARKAKCTASATSPSSASPVPCSSCVAAGVECILIESQRGKYPRRPRVNTGRRVPWSSAGTSAAPFIPAVTAEPLTGMTTTTTAAAANPTPSTIDEAPSSPDPFYAQIAQQGLNNANDDDVHGTVNGNGGDEDASQPVVPASVASLPTATNSTSPPTDTVFLGEAFSLTYMLHDVLAPILAADARRFRRRLHLPLLTNRLPPARSDAVSRQTEHLRKLGLAEASPGADADPANMPPIHDDALLDFYFEHFHPAFPIVHCAQFRAAVADGTASLLVLNAVRMVATTIYDGALLVDAAGRPQNRHALRRTYYQRAKALYDGDLEPDKYDSIAGAFLMSFWWDGPDDQQDSWHWLGVATSLAQSLGLHRSYVLSICGELSLEVKLILTAQDATLRCQLTEDAGVEATVVVHSGRFSSSLICMSHRAHFIRSATPSLVVPLAALCMLLICPVMSSC